MFLEVVIRRTQKLNTTNNSFQCGAVEEIKP